MLSPRNKERRHSPARAPRPAGLPGDVERVADVRKFAQVPHPPKEAVTIAIAAVTATTIRRNLLPPRRPVSSRGTVARFAVEVIMSDFSES